MAAALDLKVIAPVVYNRVRSGVAGSAWHWQVTGVVSVCSFQRGIPITLRRHKTDYNIKKT
jgi:hypothetical protein